MLSRITMRQIRIGSLLKLCTLGILGPAILTGCSQLGALRNSGPKTPLPRVADSTDLQDRPGLDSRQQISDNSQPSMIAPASAVEPVNSAGPVAFAASAVPETTAAPCELPTEHYGCQCGAAECGTTGCQTCMPQQKGMPFYDRQEYVCDGGDLKSSVVIRDDWSAIGIEPTDTVVYYETETGKVCVKPSNRVCIYAPRFGAVRQVSGAILAAGAVGTERVLAPVTPGRFDESSLAGSLSQPLAPLAFGARKKGPK